VRALLGAARDLDPVLALPSDGGPGALEVEPLGHFLGGLVQGVVDLLSVELGHDVETGFGGQRVLTPRLFSQWIASTCGYPRGRFGSAWGPDTASELSRGLDGGRCCDLPESLAHETDFALRPIIRYSRSCVTTSRRRSPGRLPERPKGADCKSAGSAFEGSNPSPATPREDPGDRHERRSPGFFVFRGRNPSLGWGSSGFGCP